MKIKLRFLGATENVTGSRFLLEADGSKILVDCGLYQERELRERNWDDFPVAPGEIDAVLLTHAHLDHCGWLPRLVNHGFKGKIHCTTATAELTEIVLLDSAKIQMEDAEFKQKRHKKEGRTPPRPVRPLYTIEDAQACLPLFNTCEYNQPVQVREGIEATFHDAGHILGAAMIQLKVQIDGEQRILLFSGDVGRWNKPILRDPTVFEEADYVLVESTYGDRLHDKTPEIKAKLAEIITSTRKAGGNVVIPSFAIERSQELLYYLNELLLADRVPHLMVFLDSPMAMNATKVFQEHPELFDREMTERVNHAKSPFNLPGLKMTQSSSESKAINHISGTVLIIAGSGMCTGGRIKHHLVNNITRPESTILFVGYQARGTLGREIINGAKEVRILGQIYPVKAKIARIHGFSAHADREELLRWLAGLKRPPRKVFVIHGESEAAHTFADTLHKEKGWNAIIPSYQDEVMLD